MSRSLRGHAAEFASDRFAVAPSKADQEAEEQSTAYVDFIGGQETRFFARVDPPSLSMRFHFRHRGFWDRIRCNQLQRIDRQIQRAAHHLRDVPRGSIRTPGV